MNFVLLKNELTFMSKVQCSQCGKVRQNAITLKKQDLKNLSLKGLAKKYKK